MADTAVYTEPDAKLGHNLAEPASQMHTTNKRKRSSLDHGDSSNSRHGTAPGDSSFLSAHASSAIEQDSMEHNDFSALVQHNNGEQSLHQNGGNNTGGASNTAAAALSHYTMTVPTATEISFQAQNTGESDRSFSMGDHNSGLPDFSANQGQQSNADHSPPSSASKPAVGSDEWHKVRRDNHKEVERRRRETINEGINELAKIVPGCEKNKGSILQRAVQFITQLKENENQNIEKWTLEKLVTEQALAELSEAVDKHRADAERAWKQNNILKEKLKDNGIEVDLKDLEENSES